MISLHQALPFWNTLSELQQEEIVDQIIIRQYAAGETIIKRAGLYIVNDGRVVAYACHESGRRRTVLNVQWTESLLLTQEFLNDNASEYLELNARENAEIIFIPYIAWQKIQKQHPEAYEFSIAKLSAQMSAMTFVLYTRLERNLSKRLSQFLLRLYQRGKKQTGSTIRISHEELAEQIDTTREVVTRNVSILKDMGLVETGRERIRITDPERLARYIEGAFDEPKEVQ